LRGGSEVMERIGREIRKASAINTITATDLLLDTTDDAGESKTLEFVLAGNNIELRENGAVTGNLNGEKTVVTALTFTEISTANGSAVKIFLTVRSASDTAGRSVDYYDTIILRGEYSS